MYLAFCNQATRTRAPAIATYERYNGSKSEEVSKQKFLSYVNSLFFVIRRVSKDTRVKSAPHAVETFHLEAMAVRMNKIVIKNFVYDPVHELTTAMRQYMGLHAIGWP